MRIVEPIPAPAFVLGSSQGELLEKLYALYRELDLKIDAWQQLSRTACPAGCGACCARYEPSVLPLEGMAVAAFISIPVLEGPPEPEGTSCVFFDPHNPHHCTVYAARPLECRLFAFSAARGKDGRLRFRLCRDMPGPEPRAKSEEALLSSYGALPPAMADFSTRLQTLADGPVLPLRDQARLAWKRLELLRRLTAQEPGAAAEWVVTEAAPGYHGSEGAK